MRVSVYVCQCVCVRVCLCACVDTEKQVSLSHMEHLVCCTLLCSPGGLGLGARVLGPCERVRGRGRGRVRVRGEAGVPM